MDQFAGAAASWLRIASRMRRFKRLRTTALPTARGVVNPNRAGRAVAPEERKQNAAK